MQDIAARELFARIGKEIGVSRWFEVDQARIDAFAKVTEDEQFIHVDPERASATPFRGTIAHGFLSLSLLAPMSFDVIPTIAGQVMAVNYGFDRVRMLSPVPSGRRVRGRFVVEDVTERSPGQFLQKCDVTVEIEGIEKPALKAAWLTLLQF